MRNSRRPMNPIFVQDEEHHWKPQRSLSLQLLTVAGLAAGLALLVLLVTA